MCVRVGDSAKHSFALNPKNTGRINILTRIIANKPLVFDVKRLIGRRMDDPSLQKELRHL
jgi:hypothetical protein